MTASVNRETDRGAIPADTYAHRLMLARAHAGNLTIRAAAELAGLNHANWANWEQGMRSRTQLEDARAISDALGIDLDWLLWGGPLAKPAPRKTAREVFKSAGRGRLTEGYGGGVIRTRARSSHVAAGVGSTAIPDRPTPSRHRPAGRNEGASTGPGLTRPAILPRRTSA